MPFKHYIQRIEGRLPQYTVSEPTGKPKFPYSFNSLGYDHQLIEFINGEHDRYDTDEIVTTHQAFLWRETPQGHDFWEQYAHYTFDELPLYVKDIIYDWVEEFDVGEEVEFESVEEDTEEDVTYSVVTTGGYTYVDESSDWPAPTPEEVRLVTELERLREPLAVRVEDTVYEWADRRGWIIRDA